MTHLPGIVPWTGTRALVGLRWRTHRWALTGWPIAIATLMTSTAFGIRGVYDTDQARTAYRTTVGESPIWVAFNGRGYDMHTIGGIVVYEVGFYVLLVLPVIAMHLMIRMTRAEEEAGRDELLTAGRVGLLAPLAAGTIVVSASMLSAGALTAAGFLASGLPLQGSLTYSLGLGLTLLGWGAAGLVAAQLSRSSRGAHAWGLIALGGLFLLRALVDGRGSSGTWANPTGWQAEIRPFGQWRAWPLTSLSVLTIVLVMVAIALRRRRDLGSGLLAERPGPRTAREWICHPAGLAWRLGRGSLVGWTVGSVLWGGVLGLMAPEMRRLLDANPELARYLGGSNADGNNLLIAMNALLAALLAAAFGVQLITRLASDEGCGRLGLVLSTRVGRLRWLIAKLGVTAAGATVICAVGGLFTDIALAIIGESQHGRVFPGPALSAAVAMVPGVFVIIACTALAWAIAPRLANLGWAVVAWASLVGLLGDTLRLPTWSRDLSPLHHVGQIPIDPFSPAATTVLLATAVALMVATSLRFRRRDLAAG